MLTSPCATQLLSDFAARFPDAASAATALSCGACRHRTRPTIWIHTHRELAKLPSSFEGFDVCIERDEGDACSQRVRRITSFLADHARMTLGKVPRRAWPGMPGASLGWQGGTSQGTVGCFVRHAASGASYALTCRHVLPKTQARLATGRVVTWISGSELHDLGELVDLPLANYDAACVAVRKPATNWIPGFGRMSRDVATFADVQIDVEAKHFPEVVMFGATSGLSFGELTRFKLLVTAGIPAGPMYLVITPTHRGVALSPSQRHNTAFCDEGDSGAVVCLSATRQPLGLLCRKLKGNLLTRGMIQSISEILQTANLNVR
jgi:hypothetical protein